jgi:hypothetical protein
MNSTAEDDVVRSCEKNTIINTTVASAGKTYIVYIHLHVRHATGCTP